jgi:hypothetical protein
VPAAAKSVVALSEHARSPKKVVQGVRDELGALLTRGYSVEEVGKELRGAGIEISAGTLRSYARSATKRASDAASSPAGPAKRKTAARKTAAAKLSTSPPAPAKGRVAGTDFHLAKATFAVRPDTPDSDL